MSARQSTPAVGIVVECELSVEIPAIAAEIAAELRCRGDETLEALFRELPLRSHCCAGADAVLVG